MNLKKSSKKIKWTTITETMIIFLLVYLIFVGLAISFNFLAKNKIINQTATVIPYPVATVGTQVITYKKLTSELKAVEHFYENQDFSQLGFRVDFSTNDGKKRLKVKEKNILGKLIENAVIKKEAQKRGIDLTPAIVDEEVDRKLREYGLEDNLKNKLKKLYDWNLNDFKENIVEPDMYRNKLFAQLRNTDPSYAVSKKKIEKAKSELDEGVDFSSVAKKYSMGKGAQEGGKLGWFTANQMVPEVAKVVFRMNKNQVSKVIESSLGFHIVKVEDYKTENGVTIVKISQIFIRTKSFSEWLSELEKKQKIFMFLNELKWNQKKSQLEFRYKKMQKFEDDLLKNSSNDPSVIF